MAPRRAVRVDAARPVEEMRPHVVIRALALAAVMTALAAVAVVLLGPGADRYAVRAQFQNASQLVEGNEVQVAGTAIGSVMEIELTPTGEADVRLRIDDARYRPLPRGTRAIVRQASLSGIANRYVDLQLPPGEPRGMLRDGETIAAEQTRSVVELDQLFNTFDRRTRTALTRVIRGYGASYAGRGAAANRGWEYANPALAAAARLFREVNRDTPLLRRFVRENAQLVSDLAARRDDVAGIVSNLNATTRALASRRAELGESLELLPPFMRRANTTFVNLRATLDDLAPLLQESRPAARELRPLLAELRPLARDAGPTLRDLRRLIRRTGPRNDLIELTRSNVPVRDIAVASAQRNGKEREGSLPAATKAFAGTTPVVSTLRPYAPEFTAWFDDFSHSGVAYDALGGVSRVAPLINIFAPVAGAAGPVLRPLITTESQLEAFNSAASLGQRWRCPGSLERGSIHKPSRDFPCDEREVPLGR